MTRFITLCPSSASGLRPCRKGGPASRGGSAGRRSPDRSAPGGLGPHERHGLLVMPSGLRQQLIVEGGGWRGWVDVAELVAEAFAEFCVDVEGFGQVVLVGEGLHEVAVATLS